MKCFSSYRAPEENAEAVPVVFTGVVKVDNTVWALADDVDDEMNGEKKLFKPTFFFSLVDSDHLFGVQNRKPMHYLRLMFPVEIIPTTLQYTNTLIKGRLGEGAQMLETFELYQYLGIRLAMCLDPIYGSRKEYWATKPLDKAIRQPRDYGNRFGMSRDRFELIDSCLSFGPSTDSKVNFGKFWVLALC